MSSREHLRRRAAARPLPITELAPADDANARPTPMAHDPRVLRNLPKTGKRGAPQAFPHLLFMMLEREVEAGTVHWCEGGAAFEIADLDGFIADTLVKYFRHSRYASFQRQLNLYGFKKNADGAFEHESFLRDRPELLSVLQRRSLRRAAAAGAPRARARAALLRRAPAGRQRPALTTARRRLARSLLAPAPPPPPRPAPREPSLPSLLPSPRDGSEPTTESPRSELAPPRLDDRIPSDEVRLLNRTFADVGSDTWDVDDGPGEPAAAAAAPADPDDAVHALFDEIFAPSAVFIDR
ncbi:DNA binding protein [Aureococcus anophagefferens]|nr:DNA binding protein [Aureococcus anophagefferens]